MNPRHVWRRVQLSLVRERSAYPFHMRTPSDVVALVREHLADDPRENVVAVYLDSKHKPVGIYTASTGTIDSAVMAPRDVFAPALMLGAAVVLLLHNHPSGDPSPSADDRRSTERMRQAGELLGVPMLDHIIIGEGCYYSMADERKIQLPGGAS